MKIKHEYLPFSSSKEVLSAIELASANEKFDLTFYFDDDLGCVVVRVNEYSFLLSE